MRKMMDILLIEDNDDHAELIRRELKDKSGLVNEIYRAADGPEALDFLFHQGKYKDPEKYPLPGLILLDLKLPKVDGFEVLKKIKSDSYLCIIPIVILTSSTEEEDVIKSYQNGTNSYITKPVKFIDFIKVVNEIKLYWILTNKNPK